MPDATPDLLAGACVAGAAAHADAAPARGRDVRARGRLERRRARARPTLRYAEDDARRVAALLTELGGYAADDGRRRRPPDAGRAARPAREARDARRRPTVAAGRQARVLFYYSGHARATAIDLGADELPLAELRQRLFAVPATLTVVVLDACQSGAFSRDQGRAPAADFSFNSRQHLDASGIAVLASSSGSELSQESEQLRSSYFTHHLLVGLRGAGDANHDGQVSIDEAYRYAYHQTLLATAETAVGGQHVTLEVDLKGHGEVPLSYPARRDRVRSSCRRRSRARRSSRTSARTRSSPRPTRRRARRCGSRSRPVTTRCSSAHGTTLSRCPLTARPATVDLDRCTREAIVAAATKGGGCRRRPHR